MDIIQQSCLKMYAANLDLTPQGVSCFFLPVLKDPNLFFVGNPQLAVGTNLWFGGSNP